MAGQSNAVGYRCDTPPPGYSFATDERILQVERQPSIYQYQRYSIGIAKDGLAHHFYEPGLGPDRPPCARFIGPGMTIARQYLSYLPKNRGVILIPAGYGGSTILWWKKELGSWLYADLVGRTKYALAFGGKKNRIAGVIWQQGETDYLTAIATTRPPGSITSAKEYETHLKKFFKDLQDDLSAVAGGGYRVPIVPGEFTWYITGWTDPKTAAVRNDFLQAIHNASFSVACSYPVTAQGLTSDSLHFDLPSVVTLATRHFQTLYVLQHAYQGCYK